MLISIFFWNVEIMVISLIPHAFHMARCCGTLTITMWMTILQHDFHMVERDVATPPSFPLLIWLPHDFHRSPCPSIPKNTPPKILDSCGSPKCSCCVTTHPTWWPHDGTLYYMISTWCPHDIYMANLHVDIMWSFPARGGVGNAMSRNLPSDARITMAAIMKPMPIIPGKITTKLL